MKRVVFFGMLLVSYQLQGALGCLERSYHAVCDEDLCDLPVDRKVWHAPVAGYGTCSCPCDQVTLRGKCVRCGHYGDPARGVRNTIKVDQAYR